MHCFATPSESMACNASVCCASPLAPFCRDIPHLGTHSYRDGRLQLILSPVGFHYVLPPTLLTVIWHTGGAVHDLHGTRGYCIFIFRAESAVTMCLFLSFFHVSCVCSRPKRLPLYVRDVEGLSHAFSWLPACVFL